MNGTYMIKAHLTIVYFVYPDNIFQILNLERKDKL